MQLRDHDIRLARLSKDISMVRMPGSATVWNRGLRSRMIDMRICTVWVYKATKGLSFLFWLKTCFAILRCLTEYDGCKMPEVQVAEWLKRELS